MIKKSLSIKYDTCIIPFARWSDGYEVDYDNRRVAGLDVRRSGLPGERGRPCTIPVRRRAVHTRRVERCHGDFSGKRHGIKKSIMSGV